MFKIIHFLLALVIILALAWLVSFDRRKIRIRYVLQLIVIEIALAFFFLHADWYSPALADPADFYSGYRDAAVKTERYGQAGIV